MLHHLVRIFSTPYMHIMSVCFPTDMKRRLTTKHNMINQTFLFHCILHLNAKVTSVDVVCRFQKLQQVKMVRLHVQSLAQHPPHSHTRHLQFTTHTAHRFLQTVKKRLPHLFHTFFWRMWPSCTFSFTKVPRCLKLLIPVYNVIGRWGITVRNRNNWFTLHKFQHTKCFLLRSRHYRFVTSQTEREKGSGIAHAHKTWTPAVSFHVGNLLIHAFSKP